MLCVSDRGKRDVPVFYRPGPQTNNVCVQGRGHSLDKTLVQSVVCLVLKYMLLGGCSETRVHDKMQPTVFTAIIVQTGKVSNQQEEETSFECF